MMHLSMQTQRGLSDEELIVIMNEPCAKPLSPVNLSEQNHMELKYRIYSL